MIKNAHMAMGIIMFLVMIGLVSAADCSTLEDDSAEMQTCYEKNAREKNDYRVCLNAPMVGSCVTNLAVELRDPAPILELTKEESGPSVGIRVDEDRDLLLSQYIKMTADISAWSLIESNRMHDYAVLNTPSTVYARGGYVPNKDYCDNMKGNYERDDYLNHDQTVEGEEEVNRDTCEKLVSALRQMKFENDECKDELTRRLIDPTPFEGMSRGEECEELIQYIKDGLSKISGDTENKWVLKDPVVINPNNEPTELIVGVTPNYYGPRYDGSFEKFDVQKTHIALHSKSVDNKNELWDVTFKAAFGKMPRELFPGENITISADLTGKGDSHGGYKGSCSSAMRFEFRGDGINLVGDRLYTVCMDFKEKELKPWFIVPAVGDREISITAFFWNCGACYVRWDYERNKIEIKEVHPDDALDLDLESLAPYFDIPKTEAKEPRSDFIELEDEPAENKEKKGAISRLVSWIKGLFG